MAFRTIIGLSIGWPLKMLRYSRRLKRSWLTLSIFFLKDSIRWVLRSMLISCVNAHRLMRRLFIFYNRLDDQAYAIYLNNIN